MLISGGKATGVDFLHPIGMHQVSNHRFHDAFTPGKHRAPVVGLQPAIHCIIQGFATAVGKLLDLRFPGYTLRPYRALPAIGCTANIQMIDVIAAGFLAPIRQDSPLGTRIGVGLFIKGKSFAFPLISRWILHERGNALLLAEFNRRGRVVFGIGQDFPGLQMMAPQISLGPIQQPYDRPMCHSRPWPRQ